jgi:ABC-type transporter Mla subunit MlaD
MSTRGFPKNNVLAGIFVLAGIALAVVASVVISGAGERLIPKNRYVVRFSLEDGAAGIKQGSLVNAGGQPVGHVTGVEVAREDGRPVGVDVMIAVRSDLIFFKDAYAYLEAPLLGGMASINIPNPGKGQATPQGEAGRLEDGGRLAGRLAPPSALAQAGYGPDQVTQVQAMIRQASQVVDRIDRLTSRVEQELDPTVSGIRAAVDDFRAVASDVRGRTPEWTARIDSTLASAEKAASGLNDAVEEAKARVADARKLIDTVQATLDRNTEHVDAIVANVESATRKVDTESLKLFNDALARGSEGADRFASLAARAENFLVEQSPTVRRLLANFRLASDQIKLAAVEIRAKPWLLLYSPKTKELESEVMYQAARSYAEAVSDLRAASEALEAASASTGSPLAMDRESIQGMQSRIKEAFAAYQKAEQGLLDLLIRTRKGP